MGLFETIKYDTIHKAKKIEIRKYKDILLASSTSVLTSAQDSGFSDVFRYISGSNDQEKKISMTTPVVTYEDNEKLVTGFYVPSKYKKDTVPKPIGNEVFINELKASYYIVIRFRGKWTNQNFDKHDQILLKYMKDNNYKKKSQRLIMRYQPPFVPGIFRHNEIAYQIHYPIEKN